MPLISTFGSAGSQAFGSRGVQVDGSALFNATADRLTFSSSNAFAYSTNDFTIEGWFYPTSFGSTRIIWRQNTSVYLYLNSTGAVQWFPGGGTAVITTNSMTLNAWNHVAVVKNAGSTRIFLNGVGYASVANPTSIPTPTFSPILGCYDAAGQLQYLGYITNFRICKQALYTSNFIPSLVPFTRTSQNSTTTNLLLKMTNAATLNTDSSVNNLSFSNVNVSFSTFSPYLQPYVTPPTVIVSSATVTPDTLAPSEGTTITVNVAGTNTANGTYYYSLQEEIGTGALIGADFSNGLLSGSFTINGGLGSFPLTLTKDLLTEGNEIFTIYVRTTSTSGPIIGTSAEIAITDTSLTPAFTVAPTSIDEGTSGSFTVQNIGPNGTYFWTILNSTTANADFSTTSGSFIVSGSTGGLDNGTGSFSITPVADRTSEGPQFFQVRVRSGSITGPIILTSDSITVVDASPTPSFVSAPSSIDEGSSGMIQVNNLGPAGTYYWTVLHGTTTDADFVSPNGSFTTVAQNGLGVFDVFVAADGTAEGPQTFRLQVRQNSITGTVLATLPLDITINDTSNAKIVIDAVSNTNMISLAPATVTLQTTGYSGNPYLQFNSSNYTTDTYFEIPISPTGWDANNWVLEAVFRIPTTSTATSFASGHSVVSYGTNNGNPPGNQRIGLEHFSNSLQTFESDGSAGGGSNPFDISGSIGNWIYFKTWEDVNFAGSGLLLYDLTLGVDIARVTGTPNYFYYNATPTKVSLGGNPAYPFYRKMNVDIAFVRLRKNAATYKGFPTMPFVLPTVNDVVADDVFFLIGKNNP